MSSINLRRLAGCVVLATACRGAPRTAGQPGDIIITNATLVPMDRAGTLAGRTVVVRGDRIAAVAPRDSVTIPPGAVVIDGTGKWLMPGLADMHVHISNERDLTLYAAAGVTTVRNMFGGERHLAWRSEIAQGERFGPTLVTAGPIVDGDPPVWPGSVVLARPADADQIVAEQKAQGYDFVKPYARLSRASYEALALAARRHGMELAGHVPTSVGLAGVLGARQRTIEHLDGWLLALAPDAVGLPDAARMVDRERAALAKLDLSRLPALITQTIAAGTWSCPTLIVLDRMASLGTQQAMPALRWLDKVAPEVRLQWEAASAVTRPVADAETLRDANTWKRRILAVLAAAQAPLLVGTDTGNPFVVPGEALHEEIELMIAAGIPRERVLRAATADAGTFLGRPHELGVIKVGARADLMLVATDPLTTPIPLVPDGVLLRGAWHPRGELEAKLAALTAPPVVATDRWEGVPALAPEGQVTYRAHHDIARNDATLGEERLAVGTTGAERVVVAQIVAELVGRVTISYTVGPRAVAIRMASPFGSVVVSARRTADDLHVTTTAGARAPVVQIARIPAGGFITVPGAGGLEVLATRLGGMKIGERRRLSALEINYVPTTALVTLDYDVERKPDAGGHRVFALGRSQGKRRSSGEIVVDAAGHIVAATPGWPPGLRFVRRPG